MAGLANDAAEGLAYLPRHGAGLGAISANRVHVLRYFRSRHRPPNLGLPGGPEATDPSQGNSLLCQLPFRVVSDALKAPDGISIAGRSAGHFRPGHPLDDRTWTMTTGDSSRSP